MKVLKMKRVLFGLGVVFLSLQWAFAAEVNGFRSAKFGQKESEVIAALKKDLGVTDKEVTTLTDPQTSMKVLSVKLKGFEPLEQPAVVNYVFGYECSCLTQVSVNWDVSAMKDQKTMLVRLGSLVNYFQGLSWKEGESITSKLLGNPKSGEEATLIFFRGQSDNKSSVTLLGAPVKVKLSKDKKMDANIDEIKNIVLIYDHNTEKVDSYFIQPGKF